MDRPTYDEMDVPDTDRLPWEHWADMQARELDDLGFTDEWYERMDYGTTKQAND